MSNSDPGTSPVNTSAPAAPDEIGIVERVHSRGYGFAKPLTGALQGQVFLNESRIQRLADGREIEGRLIRMSVEKSADGRYSAKRVEHLELGSGRSAKLLRAQASLLGFSDALVERLAGLSIPGEVPFTFLLVFADTPREVRPILEELIVKMPADIWLDETLEPILHLAPVQTRCTVVESCMGHAPLFALRIIRKLADAGGLSSQAQAEERPRVVYAQSYFESGVHLERKRSEISHVDDWLDKLWHVLPEARGEVVELAVRTLCFGKQEFTPVRWALRAYETGQGRPEFWVSIERELRAGKLAATAIRDDHPSIDDAPPAALALILRARFPALDHAISALSALTRNPLHPGSASAKEYLSLCDADQDLAGTWLPYAVRDEAREALTAQMMTARSAELFAMDYFRSLGLEVEDVASTQLDGSSSEWRTMDIRLDGRFGVDVKNIRRTHGGGIHSSRWKAKAFKTDARGSSVILCGVSSPFTWLKDGSLACPEADQMMMLGVTTANEVAGLMRQFGGIYRLRMNPSTRLLEIPAWSWDLPATHYRERDAAISRLAVLVHESDSALLSAAVAALPLALRAALGLPLTSPSALSSQQEAFLEMLRDSASTRTGTKSPVPRLPWLYLFILHFWLFWRASHEQVDSEGLLSLFEWNIPFPDVASDDKVIMRKPSITLSANIGIADPGDSVRKLVQALTSLEQELSRSEFLQIRNLVIYESGVLAGTVSDGTRKTLLAHCGGRDGVRECGFRPLVYGRHDSCGCGRLICPKCESCSDSRFGECERQIERKANRSEGQQEKAGSKRPWRH